MWPVGQVKDGYDSQNDGRCAFDDEQPSPACHVQPFELKQQTGNRRSNDVRNGNSCHEYGNNLCAVFIPKPVAEIHNDSRKEARLGGAKQKAQDVKLVFCMNEAHRNRDDAPADHDSGDPSACAPLFHEKAAGNFQKEVADKENAGAVSQDIVTEGKVSLHLQLRITEIHAVEVGNDKEQEHIRHDAPHDSRTGANRDRAQFNMFSGGQQLPPGEMRRQHNAWEAIVPWPELCETSNAMIQGNYIDGRWSAPREGATFEKLNPADTRDSIGQFPASNAADVQQAVDAARRALPAWRALSYEARGQFLYRASVQIAARQSEIAASLTREEGKSIPEAAGETGRGAMILRYFAAEGLHSVGEVLPSINSSTMLFTERAPLGVVGLITPWNFPVAIPLWKAAPALVYGNTVVFKPSEHSPMTAQMITEVFHEIGLPAGVFNLVQGGREAGEALSVATGLNGISFTGSVATGKAIARNCLERGLRYQLEMGGKNPVVVLEDANLDRAVELTVQGAMKSAGEKCTATSRVIVIDSIADEFIRRLATRVKQLTVGPGTDSSFYLGPVISDTARTKALRHIDAAVAQGARLLSEDSTKGRADLAHGHYVAPALLDNVRPEMAIAKEEVFAPVLAVLRVPDFDSAIRVANDVEFGLSASVFTRSLDKAMRFAREVEAGLVRVNGETAGVEPQAPFGGMKNSSSFSREQGQAAKDFYTQVKTISIDRAD